MSGPIVLALRLLMAMSLYAFLGWAFFTLWRDLKIESEKLSVRRAPAISLTVQDEGGKPITKHFIKPEIILGRDPISDIQLEDETASARHARLSYHHGQWWVEDLGSMNGTHINQHDVSIPTVLTTGDELRCGSARLTVNLSADAAMSQTIQVMEE